MLHTMSSAVPEKWIHSQDRFNLTFSLYSNLGVHPPYNPYLILRPVTCGLFSKLKERLGARKLTRVRDLSTAIRHFRAERYT